MAVRRRQPLDRVERRRAFIVLGLKGLLVGGVVGRLVWLQGFSSERYYTEAEGNRIGVRVVLPRRGRIVDRNDAALALDRYDFRAMLIPEQAKDVDRLLDRFSKTIPLSPASRDRILSEVNRNPAFVPVRIAEHIEWRTFAELNVRHLELIGVELERGFRRYYPFGALTCHTVGYVGAVTRDEVDVKDKLTLQPDFYVGRRGAELVYNESLRGAGGSQTVEVNAVGRVVKVLNTAPGIPGGDVKISLDIRVQQFLAAELGKFRRGAGAVIDCADGSVLAMVSTPSFDPNLLATGISTSRWYRLQGHVDSPLLNRVLYGLYAPGSCFKIVSLLAGLEAGIAPSTRVTCKGSLDFGGRTFHCWARKGHGLTGVEKAFRESCDIWYYELARRVGLEKVADMARRMGLGTATGIDLPGEAAGLVPGRAWKKQNRNSSWIDGDSMILYIGQGFLQTTPMQLAVMAARLATSKKITPSITVSAREAPALDVDEKHLDFVRRMCFDAVYGPRATGGAAARAGGPKIAGKTGTAQVRSISGLERESGVVEESDLPWRLRDHALFVCFSPYKNPRWASALVVEHAGGGGRIAAPIAGRLMNFVHALYPDGTSS